MSILPQLISDGFVMGSVCALTALGFALVYNTTRVFHIAHGAVYVVSAFACYLLVSQAGLGAIPAVFVTVVLAALCGTGIEAGVYAPLWRSRASQMASLLSSLGIYIVVVAAISMRFGSATQVVSLAVESTYRFGSVVLTRMQLIQVSASLLCCSALVLVLRKSQFGRMVRCIRDNPQLSAAMGINTERIRLLVVAVGSGLAAVAATLTMLDVGINPYDGMPALLAAAVAVIIGGAGTFEGPIAGAFLLGILRSLVIWKTSAQWTDALAFALLLAFLVLRPQGLFGRRKRFEENLA